MGIITEDPRPRIADSILSNADLVRPQSRREATSTVVSGRQSVALENRCLVYRGAQAGHSVVNVIPLRSIDSFCIRTFQLRSILAAALVLLLTSAATGIFWYVVPLARGLFMRNEWNTATGDLRVTAVLFAAAMILLLIYLVVRRTELVVYTHSGRNQIQLPLTRRLAQSAEAFVAEVEAEIETHPAS